MRAGGVRKNPYNGILQTLGKYTRGWSRSSAHRFSKSEDGKQLGEDLQSQGIDGTPEIQWNHQESSSPQSKRSSHPRNANAVEVDAVRMAINSDEAHLGISGNSMRDAKQCVVSSKKKGPTANGEDCIAYKNVDFRPTGYGSDCCGEGEQNRPVGWSVMNTKAERTELSQSDEEQMLQLSQESTAYKGAQTKRPFSPVGSDRDGILPKRRKQQTSEIRKRPRRAPCPNLLARDIFEILQSESQPLGGKDFDEAQTETKEIHSKKTGLCVVSERQEDRPCPELSMDDKRNQNSDTSLEQDDLVERSEQFDHDGANEDVSSSKPLKKIVITVRCKCPSTCRHIISQSKQERRFGGGLPEYGSNPRAAPSEKPRQQSSRNGKPEYDAKCTGEDTLREIALHERDSMKSLKENHYDEKVKQERMNVISSVDGVSFPRELVDTTGDRMHVNGLRQGEVGRDNCQALDFNSDESWTWKPQPSGEDGYSLSKEGVQIGLQVRHQLLAHSMGAQNDLPTPRAGRQSLVCQDTAGPGANRGERGSQPNHEDSSGDKRRISQKAISVVQPIERDTNMRPNQKNAQEVNQSLPSPLKTKRQIRRMNRKAGITRQKVQLPEKHAIVTQEGSREKVKSDEAEGVTYIPFTQTPTEPESPSHQARSSPKKHRKRARSRKLRQQGKEGTGVANRIDHTYELYGGEQDHAQQQKASGTEANSSKNGSPKGIHRKNERAHSSNYSQKLKTSNVNEEESAHGAKSPLSEPVIVRIEESPLTGKENRRGAVHSAMREKSTTSPQQDHVSHTEIPLKPDLDESIVDVDDYTAQTENVKATQAEIKSRRENLDDLVDRKELSKQSKLLLRRSRRLRNSRTESARREKSTKALDEMSGDEDSKDNGLRPAGSSSRSRVQSATAQAARSERENTHPMMTRRRASRYSNTLHRGAAVIDLTDAGEADEAATTSRTVEDDDDIAESLRELQKLSLQDRAKAFFERPRCKYLTPLSTDEDELATQLFTRMKLDTRIVAIAEAGITLRVESFKRLRGTRWLDDEVLNAYVSLINSRNDAVFRELSEEHRCGIPRAYMFNTYFFTRLCSGSSGFDYPGVRGWTKRAKVDILQKDIILVPINLGNHHWVLSGIDMERQEILYLDSMHGPDTAKAMSKLKRWVFEELRNKHGESVAQQHDPHSWKEVKHSYRVRRIGVLPETLEPREAKAGRLVKVPIQKDGGSCGVFTAKMADCLSLGIKVYFKQRDIPLIRRRMALDLFRGYVPL